MNVMLAQALTAHNLIKVGTELEVEYNAKDLSGFASSRVRGVFAVTAIEPGASLVFEAMSTVNGARVRFMPNAIVRIDGMDPARFAKIYHIGADGSALKQPTRRGRKPKHLRA